MIGSKERTLTDLHSEGTNAYTKQSNPFRCYRGIARNWWESRLEMIKLSVEQISIDANIPVMFHIVLQAVSITSSQTLRWSLESIKDNILSIAPKSPTIVFCSPSTWHASVLRRYMPVDTHCMNTLDNLGDKTDPIFEWSRLLRWWQYEEVSQLDESTRKSVQWQWGLNGAARTETTHEIVGYFEMDKSETSVPQHLFSRYWNH